MNAGTLPQLLSALGELFLAPGAFDARTFRAAAEADWAPADLRNALEGMLALPRTESSVAYAGRFLHGAAAPTIHLEASAWRSGGLQDPQVLASLRPIYAAAGIEAQDRVPSDHLGTLLSLLAFLLQRLFEAGEPEARDLESSARTLLREHLLPLSVQVRRALDAQDPPDLYRAAGGVLGHALDLCGRILV